MAEYAELVEGTAEFEAAAQKLAVQILALQNDRAAVSAMVKEIPSGSQLRKRVWEVYMDLDKLLAQRQKAKGNKTNSDTRKKSSLKYSESWAKERAVTAGANPENLRKSVTINEGRNTTLMIENVVEERRRRRAQRATQM